MPMSWLFREEHEIFRRTVRSFVEREIVPHVEEWERQEAIPREIWRRLGELGFLGVEYAEEYGGAGADFITTLVLFEELGRCRAQGVPVAVAVHTDMASPHLYHLGSEEQKRRYLPAITKGDKVCAIVVSEPEAGSDVAGIRTRARREGDRYILNGAKTFITNGVYGDLYFVAARTGDSAPGARHKGISLLMVEKGSPGFQVARKLVKTGWWCSDTAELVFQDCPVPAANLLGKEGEGFQAIMDGFQRERLVTGIIAVAGAQRALEDTLQYMTQRMAFGRPLAHFQALRHRLADMYAQVEAARALTYEVAWLFSQGKAEGPGGSGMQAKAIDKEVSAVKLFTCEMANRIAAEAVQIHGGYGYMRELAVERFFRDARVLTIGAGTSEIMRELIAKRLLPSGEEP